MLIHQVVAPHDIPYEQIDTVINRTTRYGFAQKRWLPVKKILRRACQNGLEIVVILRCLLVKFHMLRADCEKTTAIVETTDIFPMVAELAGIEVPNFVDGVSLLPQLNDPKSKGRSAVAYRGSKQTIRNEKYRCKIKS